MGRGFSTGGVIGLVAAGVVAGAVVGGASSVVLLTQVPSLRSAVTGPAGPKGSVGPPGTPGPPGAPAKVDELTLESMVAHQLKGSYVLTDQGVCPFGALFLHPTNVQVPTIPEVSTTGRRYSLCRFVGNANDVLGGP